MSIQEFKPVKEGKVREVYDNGDSMIIVATDRISAFDVILKNKITQKGAILTQMSKFWFEFTKDIVPNHMLSTNVADMPEFFRKEEFDGNSMKCKKLQMLPVECIVRGYITGSGWESYQKEGMVCGKFWKSCIQAKAQNMRKRLRSARLHSIRNVLNMHGARELSLRTPNLSLDWMKMETWFSGMKCLLPTAPGSGR